MPRPELSLCLIVRNEAAMLPDFLASVAGLWDELIAVDTGSTDQTVSLLEAAGAQVRHFEWIDDFAAARNESIREAAGAWILFLDADERVSPLLASQIRELIRNDGAGAATVLMRNELPNGQCRLAPLLRLFRNDPSIRFEYRIHEDVSTSVRSMLQRDGLRIVHLDGTVDHLGYLREVAAERNKKERDLELLRAALGDQPDDFYCWFKILEIARFWEDRELWHHTAEQAAERIDTATGSAQATLREAHWGGEFLALVSQGLGAGPAEELEWLEARTDRIAASAAWHLRRGMCLEALGRDQEAAASFEKSLNAARNSTSIQGALRPLLGLCRLAAAAGDPTRAAALAREAALAGPADPEALLALAAFHRPSAGSPLARPLRDFLDRHPESSIPLARAFLSLGQAGAVAECLRPHSTTDTEAALGLLVATMILGEPVDLRIDASREEADERFRGWVRLLLDSRQPGPIRDFLIASPSVAEAFPWLAGYLEDSLEG